MITLDLDKNENHFVEPIVSEALSCAVSRMSCCHYPDPSSTALREALAALYGVPPDHVYVGNGSDEVLATALHMLRSRWATLYLVDARFRMYSPLRRRFDYTEHTLSNEVLRTGDLSDTSGLPGIFLLDSPNAITGVQASEGLLASVVAQEESLLLLDNCYGDFGADRRLPLPAGPRAIVTRSFSKFYGLAALRLGYCIACPETVAALNEDRDMFNVNGLAQAVAVQLLQRQHLFREAAEEMKSVRLELEDGLRNLGFEVHPTLANFVTCEHPRFPAFRLQENLRGRGILVRDLSYHRITANRLRVTVPNRAGLDCLLYHLHETTKNH